MAEIAGKPGFLPEATWLAVCSRRRGRNRPEYCGTVQGVRDQHGFGAIQNLGVAARAPPLRPGHESAACGRSADFRQAGVRRVYLEVTAQNQSAIRLYRRSDFTISRSEGPSTRDRRSAGT